MRVNIFREGGYSGGGFDTSGGNITGPLLLVANPTQPLEAATKQYIDGLVNTHSGLTSLHLSSNDNILLNGINVTSTEINNLANISSNLQTQLNSKLPLSGGTLTGFITLNTNPSNTMHVATKQYVDTIVGGTVGSGLSVGDVVRKTVSTTPLSFLRCNGAQVSKTTYSALYAVIGDTFSYTFTTTPGSGQPWRQQYDINLTQSTDIIGWTTGTSLPGTV
ncbi:MAG: hypothetical protein ACD_33C00041G0013, partial [uncultured bacterium]